MLFHAKESFCGSAFFTASEACYDNSSKVHFLSFEIENYCWAMGSILGCVHLYFMMTARPIICVIHVSVSCNDNNIKYVHTHK